MILKKFCPDFVYYQKIFIDNFSCGVIFLKLKVNLVFVYCCFNKILDNPITMSSNKRLHSRSTQSSLYSRSCNHCCESKRYSLSRRFWILFTFDRRATTPINRSSLVHIYVSVNLQNLCCRRCHVDG